jgi:hypothetical protein
MRELLNGQVRRIPVEVANVMLGPTTSGLEGIGDGLGKPGPSPRKSSGMGDARMPAELSGAEPAIAKEGRTQSGFS